MVREVVEGKSYVVVGKENGTVLRWWAVVLGSFCCSTYIFWDLWQGIWSSSVTLMSVGTEVKEALHDVVKLTLDHVDTVQEDHTPHYHQSHTCPDTDVQESVEVESNDHSPHNSH